MKKIFTICALAVATIACQKQETFIPTELVETSFNVGLTTKTAMDADGGMTWVSSDNLSVFTDTDDADQQKNYKFTVSSLSADGENALFTGEVASNSQRTTIYALYPYGDSHSNTALNAKKVEVAYNGGEMSGNFVSTRFIMAGKGNVSGDDFSKTAMHMQQLTWVWDITINNPEAKPITAVQLNAGDNKIFPCSGILDLTADELVVVPNFYRASVQYNFSKAQTGESVLARFPLFPMVANPDIDMEIVVKFEDGTDERFSRKAPSKATEAGKRYHNSYTLGQGNSDDIPEDLPVEVPEGYILVKKGEDLKAKLNGQMNSESVSEVKLYLESSSTEALSFDLGAVRINPTKSIYIMSDPANIKPVIKNSAGCTIEIKDADLTDLTFSFKNIEFSNTANGDFLQISNNGVNITLFEVDNCVFRNYRHSLIRTQGQNVPSGVSFTGASVESIVINNSIFRMKAPTDAGKSLFYFQKQGDRISNIKITDSTFENVLYFIQNNMVSASGTVDYTISNNTFVNTVGVLQNGRTYFVRFINGVKGTITLESNLFGGSNSDKATSIGLLCSNNVTATYSNNYATSDWRSTFELYSADKSVDFLEVTGTNDEVFTNLADFDLTLKSGTTAYGANAGDSRWLPTSSAGLGDLEIEDTEF